MKLEVWDSPNSAGVMIDAVRCAKLALDRGIGGSLVAPSSYFMKTPPTQFTDDEAREMTEEYISADGKSTDKTTEKALPAAESKSAPRKKQLQSNGGGSGGNSDGGSE
jgi:myo-inositol-1-phosphate synthase